MPSTTEKFYLHEAENYELAGFPDFCLEVSSKTECLPFPNQGINFFSSINMIVLKISKYLLLMKGNSSYELPQQPFRYWCEFSFSVKWNRKNDNFFCFLWNGMKLRVYFQEKKKDGLKAEKLKLFNFHEPKRLAYEFGTSEIVVGKEFLKIPFFAVLTWEWENNRFWKCNCFNFLIGFDLIFNHNSFLNATEETFSGPSFMPREHSQFLMYFIFIKIGKKNFF